MTISFEKLKARLLADPGVKAEYEALASEFENPANLPRKSKAGQCQQPGDTTPGALSGKSVKPVKPLA
jgi:hypothetical protein